jgi:predicted nucleotidyltransferase
MGGSGGGGPLYTTGDAEKLREGAITEAERASLEADVNARLGSILANINERDVAKVAQYLEEIKEALSDQIEGFDTLLFGGSVAKHTYVDGLSDIDSLVIVENPTRLRPRRLQEAFAEALQSTLGRENVKEVKVGNLAVTIEYKDGTEVQLLPAVRQGDGFVISSSDGKSWRRIEPKQFAERLTRVNQAVGGGVVPVIKLAKSVIAGLPQDRRLSGYHAEALAIAAFEGYRGKRTPMEMLKHFFDIAAKNVERPIHDVTGQSSTVDEYLGPAGSEDRRRVANSLARVARQMQTAMSVDEWDEILNPES